MDSSVIFGNDLLDRRKVKRFVLAHNIGDVHREDDERDFQDLKIDILLHLLEMGSLHATGRQESPNAEKNRKKKRNMAKASRRINRRR